MRPVEAGTSLIHRRATVLRVSLRTVEKWRQGTKAVPGPAEVAIALLQKYPAAVKYLLNEGQDGQGGQHENTSRGRNILLLPGHALFGAHGAASPDAAQGLVSDVCRSQRSCFVLDVGRVSNLGCGQKAPRMAGYAEPASQQWQQPWRHAQADEGELMTAPKKYTLADGSSVTARELADMAGITVCCARTRLRKSNNLQSLLAECQYRPPEKIYRRGDEAYSILDVKAAVPDLSHAGIRHRAGMWEAGEISTAQLFAAKFKILARKRSKANVNNRGNTEWQALGDKPRSLALERIKGIGRWERKQMRAGE